MDWAQCFNEAIRFLENDLTQPPDVEAAARIAGCSVFHFQRMFAYVAGMPLSQYLRRRKMSLAAEELQNGGKITDVALRYGYASPTAFNRAFQAVHGIAPSEAKKEGAALRAYPPIRFSLALARRPLVCLDYVLLHELAHLQVPNHGNEFTALLDRYMPNWRDVRALLNGRA